MLDLALELLGAAPELQPLQLRDDELQVLDLGTAREHQRLQRIDIFGKRLVLSVHEARE